MTAIGDKDFRTPDGVQQAKNADAEKQKRAENRVKQIKGFFIHASLYLLINTMITVVKIVGTPYYGENFMGPIWHFSTFATWLIWGIGLLFHGIKVFGLSPFFGKDWEQRQIQKYMEEDQNEANKYK